MKATQVVALFGALVLVLVAVACGDDDDGGAVRAVTVSLGADGIEVPSEVAAGAVEVTVVGAPDDMTEVDFSRVEEGTSEEQFLDGLGVLLDGGPFPDFLLGNAGVTTRPSPATVLLEPGSYFVWVELGGGDGPGEVVATPVTVTGDGGGELPAGDGSIVAADYGFDVDVAAGDVVAFRNDGPAQFHHAVLFDFGELDPAVVEENLPALFAAEEGAPPPEAFADVDFERLDVGGSGVFGPGSGGTFAVELESGTTYAVVCFIQDRAGGPPHAIAYEMYDVFEVG